MALCICCQPEGSGDELTRLAEAAGFATFELPLVALRTDEPGLSELKSFLKTERSKKLGVVFSSKMAVRTALFLFKGQEAEFFAVGSKTAEQIEGAGFKVRLVGESDLDSLYREVIDTCGVELELIHVSGELSAAMPEVRRFVVYKTEDLTPDESVRRQLSAVLVGHERIFWLFTNARSAGRLGELVEAGVVDRPRGIGVAIGASTLKQVSRLGFESCLVAEKPTNQDLVCAAEAAVARQN